MNSAEEIASGLVVASGDAAVLLKPCEEVFDQMASFVQMPVVVALILARAARWNHDGLAGLEQRADHASVCVVGLVGDEGLGRGVFFEQDVRDFEIMGLSRREVKARRVAQRIHRGVNLRAQAPSAAPDGLGLRRPPFAPELCWWARAMVESIITYSLSASCDKALNTRSHTPALLQREWRKCTTRKSRTARAGLATGCPHGTDTAPLQRTTGVPGRHPNVARPGSNSLMRSHWSSLSAYLRPIGSLLSSQSAVNARGGRIDDRP